MKPLIAGIDLESVLVPEIWIEVSEKSGIGDLRLTTRDIPDYDLLMKKRIEIINSNNIFLKDIQDIIRKSVPLPGAVEFLNWLRTRIQVVILSDTFYEFAMPVMEKFSYPAIFCNNLEVDENNRITGYKLRQKDGKKESVRAFKGIGFKVISIGDSYNDISMLSEADRGILFKAPESIVSSFPEFHSFREYEELKKFLISEFDKIS